MVTGVLERSTQLAGECTGAGQPAGGTYANSGLYAIFLGFMHTAQGDYLSGQAYLIESLQLFQELGDTEFSAWALHILGVTARDHGDAAMAQIRLEESLVLFQAIGERQNIAMVLITLGEVAVLQEDAARATSLLEHGLALSREVHGTENIGWSLNHLGHVAQLQRQYKRAVQLHEEGLALFRELGVNLGVAWCLAGLGSAAALDEAPERAARVWGAAERLRQAIGCRPAPAARATYERAMASARAQLGEEAFAAAWAAGRVLTLEQAVAEALAPS
jgi:tetratricopeptide (TPR) repeat protein